MNLNFEDEIHKIFQACDGDTIFRAVIFLREAGLMPLRGWENHYNHSLLFIEPPHPYTQDQLGNRFKLLGFNSEIIKKINSSGISIVNLPLISLYFESLIGISPYGHLPSVQEKTKGDFLFDPYYGHIFWQEQGRYRNSVISLEEGMQLKSSTVPLLKWLGELNPSYHIAQGTVIASLLFGNHFGPEVRNSYNASEVAEIVVSTEKEFFNLVDKLNKLSNFPKLELWYRGQTNDYLMHDRLPLHSLGLVPYGDVRDSSLVPSLYRSIDQFYKSYTNFNKLIQGIEWWWNVANNFLSLPYTIRFPWEEPTELAPGIPGVNLSTTITTIHKEDNKILSQVVKDYHHNLNRAQRGLLLQHYGCPTSWIDITSDPSIALWFALHQFNALQTNSSYTSAP